MTPAAMTGTGDVEEGERDVAHWSGQLADAVQDKPELKGRDAPGLHRLPAQAPGRIAPATGLSPSIRSATRSPAEA